MPRTILVNAEASARRDGIVSAAPGSDVPLR